MKFKYEFHFYYNFGSMIKKGGLSKKSIVKDNVTLYDFQNQIEIPFYSD